MQRVAIVLASGSPRRRAILKEMGVAFVVSVPACVEVFHADDPVATVGTNARHKALAAQAHHRHAAIIAADTVVSFQGKVLGKPADEAQARAWLLAYAGRAQTVFTGVALLLPGAAEPSIRIEATGLQFKDYGPEVVEAYLRRVRPLDRAGAYDVNALGHWLIAGRVGAHSNAMGLPRGVVRDWLMAHGLWAPGGESRD